MFTYKTLEMPIEQVMRDARASMIENREKDTPCINGIRWLSRRYQGQHGLAV